MVAVELSVSGGMPVALCIEDVPAMGALFEGVGDNVESFLQHINQAEGLLCPIFRGRLPRVIPSGGLPPVRNSNRFSVSSKVIIPFSSGTGLLLSVLVIRVLFRHGSSSGEPGQSDGRTVVGCS
jgi:hypothetical protein